MAKTNKKYTRKCKCTLQLCDGRVEIQDDRLRQAALIVKNTLKNITTEDSYPFPFSETTRQELYSLKDELSKWDFNEDSKKGYGIFRG